MAPVLRGMCKFESLKDGALDIADIALMNDAMRCERDNDKLAREMADH